MITTYRGWPRIFAILGISFICAVALGAAVLSFLMPDFLGSLSAYGLEFRADDPFVRVGVAMLAGLLVLLAWFLRLPRLAHDRRRR